MKIRGMTLVELLVAMALASVVLTAALTASAQARSAYHSAQLENRLHERAQYVFATLEPELQMAGYFGIGAQPFMADLGVAGSAARCEPGLLIALDHGIEVADHHNWVGCAAQGGGAAQGADVLTLRRASSQLAAPEAGRIQLLGSAGNILVPRVIVDGQLPPGTVLSPPKTELRDLLVRIYYVARSADGDSNTPALRVKSLSAISGRPAFIDTEVMPGVENLQVELLPDVAIPQLVTVHLTVRADAADQRTGEALRRLVVTRHFRLRNAH